MATVPGRSCGGCTLCCKLLPVISLAKPPGTWCRHADQAKGCRIYGEHPGECRVFHCGWMVEPSLGDHWRPTLCRMVVTYEAAARRIAIQVDRPGAWRAGPWYSDIRRLAASAARERGQVIVWHGARATAVVPGGEVDLGIVREGQVIVTIEHAGRSPELRVMEGADPAVAALGRQG